MEEACVSPFASLLKFSLLAFLQLTGQVPWLSSLLYLMVEWHLCEVGTDSSGDQIVPSHLIQNHYHFLHLKFV